MLYHRYLELQKHSHVCELINTIILFKYLAFLFRLYNYTKITMHCHDIMDTQFLKSINLVFTS